MRREDGLPIIYRSPELIRTNHLDPDKLTQAQHDSTWRLGRSASSSLSEFLSQAIPGLRQGPDLVANRRTKNYYSNAVRGPLQFSRPVPRRNGNAPKCFGLHFSRHHIDRIVVTINSIQFAVQRHRVIAPG